MSHPARFAQFMVSAGLMRCAVRNRNRAALQNCDAAQGADGFDQAESKERRHWRPGVAVRQCAEAALVRERPYWRYCWMRVVRNPARPCWSIEYCQDRNSSTVRV